MTPELRTYDVALVMPDEVAERDGFVPNADGDCICWMLLDAADSEDAIRDARRGCADEIGGEPGQYSPIAALVVRWPEATRQSAAGAPGAIPPSDPGAPGETPPSDPLAPGGIR